MHKPLKTCTNWKVPLANDCNIATIKKNMLNSLTNHTEIIIKPCKHKVLAQAYGISNKVLHTHLKQVEKHIGKRIGHFYTLKQLLTIIEKIGMPCYPIQ
jgi:hypothetical protein